MGKFVVELITSKQKIKFTHIFDLTLILRTLNRKYLHTLIKGKTEQM